MNTNIIGMFKILIFIEWILFAITIIALMSQLLMLTKGHVKFLYTLYSAKSLGEIRVSIIRINNKINELKKELLISSYTVIIALLSMFILVSFLNIKIGFPPDTFLWMVGGFVIIPLFIITFDFYLERIVSEIDKIKAMSLNKNKDRGK